MDTYFGPLGAEYCIYFYTLSIIFGITFVLSLFYSLYYIIFNFKKLNTMGGTMGVVNTCISSLIAYLVNRLLHTMCMKSLL